MRPQKHDLRVHGDFSPELPAGVKLFRTFEGHEAIVFGLAFDPRGETLASASNDKTIKLWDLHKGDLLRTLEGHQRGVWSVSFDPQGEILASGSEDFTVRLWGAPKRQTAPHPGGTSRLCF